MKKCRKTQKGITLVALVITIVILLILTGISISALTNQGLFGQAQEAKKKTENAQVKEDIILNEYSDKINKVVGSREVVQIDKSEYEQLIKDKEYQVNDKIEFDEIIGFVGFSNAGGSGISVMIPLSKEISTEITNVSATYQLIQIDCNGTRYTASNFSVGKSEIVANKYLRITIDCKSSVASMTAANVLFKNLTLTFN